MIGYCSGQFRNSFLLRITSFDQTKTLELEEHAIRYDNHYDKNEVKLAFTTEVDFCKFIEEFSIQVVDTEEEYEFVKTLTQPTI